MKRSTWRKYSGGPAFDRTGGPIPARFKNHVLSTGQHHGFDWFTARNNMGYRCGYVIVPPGHPWFGQDYDSIAVECHGGLTFSDSTGFGAWCVGFDCAHAGDAPDPTLPGTHHIFSSLLGGGDVIRSLEFVEAECCLLCAQAAAASNAAS